MTEKITLAAPKFRNVVVTFAKLKDYKQEIKIDINDCDDFYLEACTRAVELNIKNNKTVMAPFIEAKIKNKKTFRVYNAYKILINASYHIYAKNLRDNFKKSYNVDLNDEPIRAKIK